MPKEVSTNVKSETLHDLKVLELDENQMKHKKIIAKIVLDVIITSLTPQLKHTIIVSRNQKIYPRRYCSENRVSMTKNQNGISISWTLNMSIY